MINELMFVKHVKPPNIQIYLQTIKNKVLMHWINKRICFYLQVKPQNNHFTGREKSCFSTSVQLVFFILLARKVMILTLCVGIRNRRLLTAVKSMKFGVLILPLSNYVTQTACHLLTPQLSFPICKTGILTVPITGLMRR